MKRARPLACSHPKNECSENCRYPRYPAFIGLLHQRASSKYPYGTHVQNTFNLALEWLYQWCVRACAGVAVGLWSNPDRQLCSSSQSIQNPWHWKTREKKSAVWQNSWKKWRKAISAHVCGKIEETYEFFADFTISQVTLHRISQYFRFTFIEMAICDGVSTFSDGKPTLNKIIEDFSFVFHRILHHNCLYSLFPSHKYWKGVGNDVSKKTNFFIFVIWW